MQSSACTKWAGQWSAGAWSLSWLQFTVSHTLHTVLARRGVRRRVMCPSVSCLYGFCHCVTSPALIFLLLLHFTLVSFHCRSRLPIKTRLTTMTAAPPAASGYYGYVLCRTLQHKRRITTLRGQCCLSPSVSIRGRIILILYTEN